MLTGTHFSHKQLHGLSGEKIQELLWREKDINWNDLPGHLKRGCVWWPEPTTCPRGALVPAEYHARYTSEALTETVETTEWRMLPAPWFTRDRDWLTTRVPKPE